MLNSLGSNRHHLIPSLSIQVFRHPSLYTVDINATPRSSLPIFLPLPLSLSLCLSICLPASLPTSVLTPIPTYASPDLYCSSVYPTFSPSDLTKYLSKWRICLLTYFNLCCHSSLQQFLPENDWSWIDPGLIMEIRRIDWTIGFYRSIWLNLLTFLVYY